MRVLIAEDDLVSRRVLQATLTRLGYDPIVTEDGAQAWEVLNGVDPPQLAVLDWMMPELDGVEVCRRVRERGAGSYTYIILLTAKGQKSDVVAGLDSGADDYLTKPFDPYELKARIHTGERIVALEQALAKHIDELSHALRHVKQLQGLLPICMHCKKIRDDHDSWHRIENYIEHHTDAMFTHSLCQDCLDEHYPQNPRARARAKMTT